MPSGGWKPDGGTGGALARSRQVIRGKKVSIYIWRDLVEFDAQM